MAQVVSQQEDERKTGFVAKDGNAWYLAEMPGKTCVLPPYHQTREDVRAGPEASVKKLWFFTRQAGLCRQAAC
jgi:hypothetical protein